MADNVKLVHDGTIGFFWPGASRARSLRRAPERGYVRRGDDGMLHLAVLDESNLWHTEVDPHLPSLITGMTEAGGIVLLDIAGAGRTTRFGGSAASAKRYRARTLVAGVDVDRIRSGRVGSMSAHFFGISSWFGLTTVEEGQEFHPESDLLKSYTITVDSSPGKHSAVL
jgi:hypothetical protein